MQRKIIFLVLLTLSACEKDQIDHLDCNSFKTGIVKGNEDVISREIEKLSADLNPFLSPEDLIGHMSNLELLVDRINSDCNDINASMLCYACIETYPPLSEILIEFQYENSQIATVIDIVTSKNDILHYGGMHDSQ